MCCLTIMLLQNLIILKLFLVSNFFNYVYARYPFVSTEFILYDSKVPSLCGSWTWIPLQSPRNNCDKIDNPFRGNNTGMIEKKAVDTSNEKMMRFEKENYIYQHYLDQETLHDISAIYGKMEICHNLESEVNLDIVWNIIKTKNTTRQDCGENYDAAGLYKSTCPFSSRIDLQHYVFHNEGKHRTTTDLDDRKLCEDRYGRKYPPPEGLGGKCVMFQHEFVKDGERITEFFMPIEKRDLVERISQYPYTHEIRQNRTTLNRLLPKNNESYVDENGCMTLHYKMEAFVHCIYEPENSKMFHPDPAKPNSYFCPKNKALSGVSFIQGKVELLRAVKAIPVYHMFDIDKEQFEFSENCYISTAFIPKNDLNGDLNITLEINILGSKENLCLQKETIVETGKDLVDYEITINISKENFCPWENDISYTICFKTKSSHLYSSYVEAMNRIINATLFQSCYYQVNATGCYYQVNYDDGTKSRVPSKWIPFIERGELNATKKNYENETGCGIAYITPKMKKECSEKAKQGGGDYSMKGSNAIICKCTEDLCDAPGKEGPGKLESIKNTVVCNQGSNETSLPSPFFFCSVRLTTKAENGKYVKKFNYSYIDPNSTYGLNVFSCWDHKTLTKKLADPEADENQFSTCFHSHEEQMYECCCYASGSPCNTKQIIEAYYEIANQAEKEKDNRLRVGCDFKAQISAATKNTCDKDSVRNDREMRCYGVFKVPSTNHGNVKPELVKENCYWPHPQYHDQYSIFCSNDYFEIDELVIEKCVSLFINDFTTTTPSTAAGAKEKKLDRTLIVCCNTGVYPEKRELILSRSFIVL